MQTPEYKENERLVNLKIKKMLEDQHEYENKLRSAFDKCNDNIEEFKRLLQEMCVEIKNKQFDDSITYAFTKMMNDKSSWHITFAQKFRHRDIADRRPPYRAMFGFPLFLYKFLTNIENLAQKPPRIYSF